MPPMPPSEVIRQFQLNSQEQSLTRLDGLQQPLPLQSPLQQFATPYISPL